MSDEQVLPFQQKIDKPWGYELILNTPSSPITAKILHINSGCQFSLQYHEIKEENLTLVSGEAKIILGGVKEIGDLREETMEKYKGYFIPKGLAHRCRAITDCDIFESSTLELGTTVRLQDDYGRKDETEEERLKNRTMNHEL